MPEKKAPKIKLKSFLMLPSIRALIIGLLCYSIIYGILLTAVSPKRHDVRVGSIAQDTITATKEIEDKLTTQLNMDAAVAAVQPHYVYDASVLQDVMQQLGLAVQRMDAIQSSGSVAINEMTTEKERESKPYAQLADLYTPTDVVLQWAREQMLPVVLNDEQLIAIFRSPKKTYTDLAFNMQKIIREALNSKVPQGEEDLVISRLERDLSNLNDIPPAYSAIGAIVAKQYLRPNMLIDEEVTEANRQKVRESILPVIYKKGQNIVVSGNVITEPQIEMLRDLGILKDDPFDMLLYLGTALLLLLLFMVVVVYLSIFEHSLLADTNRLSLLAVIAVLVMAVSLAVRAISVYLVPISLGAMLISLLLKPRLALIVNIAFSIIICLLISGNTDAFTAEALNLVLISITSGIVVVALSRKLQNRAGLIIAGILSGLVNMLTILALGLINSVNLQGVLIMAGWSAGSGLLSAVLCIGLQPVLESIFNLVTPSKLLELSNPNQPLLRRLLMEAPGTYHHSIIVANLAEAAAESIGANGLLVRVGSYYHDVGKLKRPLFFKENQFGDNPHDRTDSKVSTVIVTSHTRDGVLMASKYRLPKEILDIMRQHHGDTPVMYFYHKAVTAEGEANVNISDFRYEGPKPQSKEAAIVMLADTVEAAARTLPDPSPERLEALIRKLVKGKMEDQQLSESPLSFSDLSKIVEAFMKVLVGVFHERIEYPDITIPDRTLERKRLVAIDDKVLANPVYMPTAESEDDYNASELASTEEDGNKA